MKLYSSACMRQADAEAIEAFHIPSTLLMTNAATHVAAAAMRLAGDNRSAAVFCGSGNNGDDGIAAASYMIMRGMSVRLFLTGSREKLTPDSLEMLRRFAELGGSAEDFSDLPEIGEYVSRCGVIIDAMFGIGLNSPLRGVAESAVKLINASPSPVVSADIASGVDADTGQIRGCAVSADVTVTFTGAKPGHFTEPGCTLCGELIVAEIGIPSAVTEKMQPVAYAVQLDELSLPVRKRISHKGDYGRVLILGGSTGYTGAPCFASRAAVKSGAGLVFLGVPRDIYTIAAIKTDESMAFPLPCDNNGILSASALEEILARLPAMDACLLGPGLGRSDGIKEIVRKTVEACRVPLIIDADGINALSGNIDIVDSASCPVILTPHEGEFTRIGGCLPDGGRVQSARDFASQHGCILILKGHRTVTAFPDGDVFINTTGNPGMAKGGSGDALSGILAALVCQGFPLKMAIPAAVCIHGASGDLAASRFGEYSMTPSDMVELLPEVIKTITR